MVKTPDTNLVSLLNKVMILVFILLLIDGHLNGPEQWVMKYDLSGMPINHVNKSHYLFFISGLSLFLNSFLVLVFFFALKGKDLRFVNIPNKEYWIQAENRQEGLRRLYIVRDLTFLFINVVVTSIFMLSRFSLQNHSVNIFLSALLILTIIYVAYILRIFRLRD